MPAAVDGGYDDRVDLLLYEVLELGDLLLKVTGGIRSDDFHADLLGRPLAPRRVSTPNSSARE
jgi:hypothetical protein